VGPHPHYCDVVRFNRRADISGGRVSDAGRGSGRSGLGGGGGRLPIPAGGLAGGGIGTLVVIVIVLVISGAFSGGDGGGTQNGATRTDRYDQCLTGEDANNSADCARKAVEVSLENYWSTELPQQAGVQFQPTQIVTFSGSTSTGCGGATTDVGPFYCPTDQTIYLDTTFFQQVLEDQLGGQGGDFVEPYVLAHEFGHHIQNLMGTMGQVRTQSGPKSDSVRLELQADCYAGMWTQGATGTTDDKGVAIFEALDQGDIDEALDSAKAVGDDRIQQRGGGDVNPEQWTHGSAAERQQWFQTGYAASSIEDCDTFARGAL
jgi:uncharacterized protein